MEMKLVNDLKVIAPTCSICKHPRGLELVEGQWWECKECRSAWRVDGEEGEVECCQCGGLTGSYAEIDGEHFCQACAIEEMKKEKEEE